MEQKMPDLDEEQREWCVEMLQTTTPPKEIAILFRDKFSWFAPDFELEPFCKRFTPKLHDLVRNKKRPYAAIIAKGREFNKKSVGHVWMTHDSWREEKRQEAVEEIEGIAREMRSTTDKETLNSLKHAADAWWRVITAIGNYEKHLLNIDKMENKGGGHGIPPVTTE